MARRWIEKIAAARRPSHSRFRYSSVARARIYKRKRNEAENFSPARARSQINFVCLDVTSPYQIYGFLLKNARSRRVARIDAMYFIALAAALCARRWKHILVCVHAREQCRLTN
jgi:hypothetical protein